MLIDFARLTGEPPSTDVVIVGSGAAGISTADALAARGLSVLILEAGSLRNDRAALGRFFRAGSVRAHSPTELFRRRMAGGATTIWGGRCIPYEPSDFEALDDGNGARWPVGYDEITPFIDRAVPWLHAGTPVFTAAGALPDRPRQIVRSDDPALSLDEIERFSLPMNSWRDRGKALVGGRTGAHLLYNCAVIELVGDGSDRPAYDVRVAAPDGRQATIRCPMLVLASGGLETPRLLLASRNQLTAGVGNEHDLVGRFFMTHVIADAGYLEILDRSGVAQDYEVAADGAYVRRLIKVAPEERARRGLMNMVARPAIPNVADPAHRSAILSSSFLVKRFIIAEYRQRLAQRYSGAQAGLAPHLRNIVLSGHTMPFFGIDWLRRRTLARRKLPALFLDGAASYPLQLIGEQAPLRTSRVSLAEDRDPHGLPRLALDWRYGEDDVRSLTESMEIIARATADNRYARVVLDATEREKMKTLVPQGGHHIGTTRMAERPEEGVTDRWGRVWQSRNLFVAGSALFPRSGIANPTLMIVALAMRTADHIAALHKGEARLRDAT